MGSSFQLWLCARSAKFTFIVLIRVSIRVTQPRFALQIVCLCSVLDARILGDWENVTRELDM